MAPTIDRANLLIARPPWSRWAEPLARSLSPLPVELHWPRTGVEAIGLAVSNAMHLAVFDGDNRADFGLGLVRRIRRLGVCTPCLLVCDEADQRLLRDALELDVFSVLVAEPGRDLVTPMVLKVFRQVYDWSWVQDTEN
jgi:hypothetical protein